MLRNWSGIVDVTPDRSPILAKTPVKGLYVNCGWGTGGFKATPGSGNVFAHTIANDEPHPLNRAFNLDRFSTGHLIDEHGAAGVAQHDHAAGADRREVRGGELDAGGAAQAAQVHPGTLRGERRSDDPADARSR